MARLETRINVAIFGIKGLPAFSGPDRVVERLMGSVASHVDYTVYIVRDDKPYGTDRSGTRFFRIPTIPGKHLKAFVYFALCTLHYLVRGTYDVLHVHDSSFGLFVPLLKLKRGTRILGTMHGNPYDRSKWGRFAKWYLRISESAFIRNSDYLTSVAKSKVEELTAAGCTKITYIPNGIDSSPNSCDADIDFYERWKIKRNEYVLFACGRLDATKGLHHLLEAYPEGKFRFPLVVIGNFTHDRKYASEIESRCKGRADIILCKSLLPRADLLDVMKNSKLFVFPSEVEAMAMVLLEAISVHARVICSDIPENLEVVGADYPYVFNIRTGGDLAAKIAGALSDPSMEMHSKSLGERGRTLFAWSAMAQKYLQSYQTAMHPNEARS
jgi:glycosyltransferase involved in cell wall biosynthesis